MATIQVKSGDEFLLKLSKIEVQTREEIIGGALYAGAAIAADAVRAELDAIPTDESFGTTGHPTAGPKASQKEGLSQSLGIASMRDSGDGYYDVKIGFNGYNALKTKKWPSGQPNQMVARSIESGTTWMRKNPFIRRAASKSKKKAEAAMKKSVIDKVEEIMKG